MLEGGFPLCCLVLCPILLPLTSKQVCTRNRFVVERVKEKKKGKHASRLEPLTTFWNKGL